MAKAVFNGQLLLRPYATFSHPNALAGFILVALIILVPTGWLRLRAVKRIGIALGILAIIFSFSRSVWFLGLLLAFLWLGKSLWFSKINKNWGFLVGGLFLIISFWVFYLAPHFSTNEALFQRLQLMKAAWLMIKDFSLAGVGLNNFIVRLPEYWAQTGFTYWLQPVHNFYLLWLVEVGWVGLLIWLWFLFLTFKRLFPLQGQRGTLLLALMAILILGSFDHYWLTLQQNQLLLTVILGTVWSSQS
ncbi:O-antigen ligase family protein [Candidatus Shapirobacteria bacterium]|nr:O-antigen ligase family protein [Candidatus Shapirobacteria bacterium]